MSNFKIENIIRLTNLLLSSVIIVSLMLPVLNLAHQMVS